MILLHLLQFFNQSIYSNEKYISMRSKIMELMMIFSIVTIYLVRIINAHPADLNSAELSFKKLESAENSEEILNQCCQRETKFITVGYGINEGEVKLDVGQCRQHCVTPTTKPLKRIEFDRYLKKYPEMDPVQIFLNLQRKAVEKPDPTAPTTLGGENNTDSGNQNGDKRINFQKISTSCLHSLCLPNSVKRESYYDLSGEVKQVDVIESCDCVNQPQQGCQRYPSMVKIHVDTPYEREVDVGQCLGSCDNNSAENCLSCRPIRNRTITLEGANGPSCLNVIDECKCVGECFRIRQFLKVYDYTHAFAEKASLKSRPNNNSTSNNNDVIENHTNYTTNIDTTPETVSRLLEPLTKVIDIGRCSGSCSDVPVASKCLVWSSSVNGTCLSALTGGTNKCTATKSVYHSYMDVHGKKHTILSLTGCGCR